MLPQKARGGQTPVLTLFEARFLSCSLLGAQANPEASKGPFSRPPISPREPWDHILPSGRFPYPPPVPAVRSGALNQAWWYMRVIPALGRL